MRCMPQVTTDKLKERFSSTHIIQEIEGQHRCIDDWPKKLKLLRYLYPKEYYWILWMKVGPIL